MRFEKNASKDLLFMFPIANMSGNVCIHCYDGVSCDLAGRILLPLSDLLWQVGTRVKCQLFRESLGHPRTLRKRYTVRFMPPASPHDTSARGADRFSPSWTGLRGMEKLSAFGNVVLTVEVTMNPEIRSVASMYASHVPAVEATETAPVDEEESVLGLLKSTRLWEFVDLAERVHYQRFPLSGEVAWLQTSCWQAPLLSIIWVVFCVSGLFPPPLWACPLYIFALVLFMGSFTARLREKKWWQKDNDCLGHPGSIRSFDAWSGTPPPVARESETQYLKRTLCRVKPLLAQGVGVLERLLSFVERLGNMISFVDGLASVLCYVRLGIGTLFVSFLLFSLQELLSLITHFDPRLHYSSAVFGSVLLMVLSRPILVARVSDGARWLCEASWHMLPVSFVSVPDNVEAAHRFVASQVQTLERSSSVCSEMWGGASDLSSTESQVPACHDVEAQ
uniref:Uncharacterized protein n=2 Tax=Noctiluca scintillans TaxID=2966 RepID=A0A7S1F8D0_NOCSC